MADRTRDEWVRVILRNYDEGKSFGTVADEIVAAISAARQDERTKIAEELCDCNPSENPPTNPYTHQRIAHHCDCTTVVLTSKPDEHGFRHDHDCGPAGNG